MYNATVDLSFIKEYDDVLREMISLKNSHAMTKITHFTITDKLEPMKTKVHPYEQGGPDMMVGCDHDGNRVAIELIEDAMDAKRYRWLRANAKEIVFRHPEGVTCFGSIDDKSEELDSAVDAAMVDNP